MLAIILLFVCFTSGMYAMEDIEASSSSSGSGHYDVLRNLPGCNEQDPTLFQKFVEENHHKVKEWHGKAQRTDKDPKHTKLKVAGQVLGGFARYITGLYQQQGSSQGESILRAKYGAKKSSRLWRGTTLGGGVATLGGLICVIIYLVLNSHGKK